MWVLVDFEYQNGQSSNKVRTLLTSEGILIGPHIFKGLFEVGFRVRLEKVL